MCFYQIFAVKRSVDQMSTYQMSIDEMSFGKLFSTKRHITQNVKCFIGLNTDPGPSKMYFGRKIDQLDLAS